MTIRAIKDAARRQGWHDAGNTNHISKSRSHDIEAGPHTRLRRISTERGPRPVWHNGSQVFVAVERADTDPIRPKPTYSPQERPSTAPAQHVDFVETPDSIELPEKRTLWQKACGLVRSDFDKPTSGQMIKGLFGRHTLIHPRWNILLPFIPIGFAVHYTVSNPYITFVINFIAMLPSSTLFYYGIEQVIFYIGEHFGDLLSISSSNVAQLISAIFLLKTGQVEILEASLLGTILQSLLLMTGGAFLVGGVYYREQYFGKEVAQTICMLLLLAVLSLMIPTLAQVWGNATNVLQMSRGTAVIIMFSYGLYLVFQVYTDRRLFDTKPPEGGERRHAKHVATALATMGAGATAPLLRDPDAVYLLHPRPGEHEKLDLARKQPRKTEKSLRKIVAATSLQWAAPVGLELSLEEDDEIREQPSLTLWAALLLVIIATTLLTFNIGFATDSLQDLMQQSQISSTFMGIVVLPLLGNDLNSLKTASNDRMDMSIALTLERCMQTALMVIPLVVLVAWGMGMDDVTMEFDRFSVAALFAAVLIVCYVVQEGKSNWLYGALLMKVFVIVGLAAYYTDADPSTMWVTVAGPG